MPSFLWTRPAAGTHTIKGVGLGNGACERDVWSGSRSAVPGHGESIGAGGGWWCWWWRWVVVVVTDADAGGGRGSQSLHLIGRRPGAAGNGPWASSSPSPSPHPCPSCSSRVRLEDHPIQPTPSPPCSIDPFRVPAFTPRMMISWPPFALHALGIGRRSRTFQSPFYSDNYITLNAEIFHTNGLVLTAYCHVFTSG